MDRVVPKVTVSKAFKPKEAVSPLFDMSFTTSEHAMKTVRSFDEPLQKFR